MANATLRDLTAATDIAATDVLVLQNTDSDDAYYKITGANFNNALESGGGIALSLASAQVAAAGADTRVQYNNGGARGGDAEVTWDNSGKALTVGAVTATTQLKLPASYDPASPTLAFGDGDSGMFTTGGGGAVHFAVGGNFLAWVSSGKVQIDNSARNPAILDEASSATNPTVVPVGGDTNTGVGLAAADKLSLIAGGVELARLSESAKDQVMFICRRSNPSSIATRAHITASWFTSSIGFFVNETTDKLEFWARYSGGVTVKKHSLALA
jgi:hypothetical protein